MRFQGLPCISTVEYGFSPGLGDPVFPYHTGFDIFAWMNRFGDPEWKYHVVSAKLMSLTAEYTTESSVINMGVRDYSRAMQNWLRRMCEVGKCSPKVDLTGLLDTVDRLDRASQRFDKHRVSWNTPIGMERFSAASVPLAQYTERINSHSEQALYRSRAKLLL